MQNHILMSFMLKLRMECRHALLFSFSSGMIVYMKQGLEVLLNTFVENIEFPFDFFQIADYLGIKKECDINYALEWFETNPAILSVGHNAFASRIGMFTGKTFSILPTRYEITNKILVVGHRCIPFGNPDILPCDYKFFYNKKSVPYKIVEMQTNDLFEYYYLHGEEFVPQYLALDPANKDFDIASCDYELPGKMKSTVLDMTAIYEKNDFKSGDRLKVRLENWRIGTFSIVVQKDTRETPFEVNEAEESRNKWFEIFEKNLLQSFNVFGVCSSIDEQIAFAYVLSGKDLFMRYPGSVEEYIKKSEVIETTEFGVETRLWRTGETISVMNLHNESDQDSDETGEFDGVSRLFLSIGVPLTETFLDSFIYDSLYKKEKNSEQIISRLLPEGMGEISSKDMIFCFLHLEKRRAILQRDYRWFADYEKGQLRAKILKFYARMINFVYSMGQNDVSPEAMPQQPLVVLSQLFTHLGRMLESIMPNASISSKDITSLYLSLEGMEFSFEDLSKELEQSINIQEKEKFTIIRKEDGKHE